MKDRTGEWIREQIKSFRVTWNQAPALPLSEWLTTETVARMVSELKFTGRDRVDTPLVTLWVFLSQVLVYREIREGRLKCHCFGRRTYRISEEELAAYMDACAHERMPEVKDNNRSKSRQPAKENGPGLFRHIDVSRLLARQS